jgi:hypothetical protein
MVELVACLLLDQFPQVLLVLAALHRSLWNCCHVCQFMVCERVWLPAFPRHSASRHLISDIHIRVMAGGTN